MDRAALVTGGSSGIGLAIARMLGEEGFGLTLASRTRAKVEAAAEELGAHAVTADVSDEEDCRRVVQEHAARWGRLDMLVNSAGVGVLGRIDELPTKQLDLQLDVNLRGLMLVTAAALPLLREARGLVVNLSSFAGKSGQPWLSVYSATKAAVVAYTVAMNKELNNDGVKSVAFCPGFVDTDMADFIKDTVPAETMLKTSDIAEALKFMLRVSPACLVSEIVFQRPGETI